MQITFSFRNVDSSDAVRNYATEGEICGVLLKEFGEYKENVVL